MVPEGRGVFSQSSFCVSGPSGVLEDQIHDLAARRKILEIGWIGFVGGLVGLVADRRTGRGFS